MLSSPVMHRRRSGRSGRGSGRGPPFLRNPMGQKFLVSHSTFDPILVSRLNYRKAKGMKVIDLHPPPACTESYRRKCSLFTKKMYLHKKGISSPKLKFQIIHTSKRSFFLVLT
jgi:hypothetical protein